MPAPNTPSPSYGSLGIVFINTAFTRSITIPNASSYALTAGSLPQGVSLSSSGVLSGIPVIPEPASNQPIYVFVFRVTATTTGGTVNQIYSISVLTTGLYQPDRFDLTSSQTLESGYRYQLPLIETPTNTRYWRLKWGDLPPTGLIYQSGSFEIGFPESILPLARESFIRPDAPLISSLSQASFDTWARTFFSQAHELDYQFVIEFADDSGLVVAGHTVRIVHTRVPTTGNTWFSQNSQYIAYDANQYYYFVATTLDDNIVWVTDNDLGYSINGSISDQTLVAESTKAVSYTMMSNDYNRIPQGCALLPSGLISGRISFRCHQDDPVNIPLNDQYDFTVRAATSQSRCYSDRRFTWRITRENPRPTDNLYIRPFPRFEERVALKELLTDPNVIDPDILYRYSDPWWNPGYEFKFLFEVGLNHKDFIDYELATQDNHRKRSLLFDRLKVAYHLNDDLTTRYEVVYLTFIDLASGRDLSTGVPVAARQNIDLRSYISNYYVKNNTSYYVFEPGSLETMRSVINNSIGATNRTRLIPGWMTSIQPTDRPGEFLGPIGLIPAVILAYTRPGLSSKVITALRDVKFNNYRFEFDRYIWEDRSSMTYNFQSNTYTVGSTTVFDSDTTQFDQNATRFVSGLEYYSSPGINDKYVVFPKSGVFV